MEEQHNDAQLSDWQLRERVRLCKSSICSIRSTPLGDHAAVRAKCKTLSYQDQQQFILTKIHASSPNRGHVRHARSLSSRLRGRRHLDAGSGHLCRDCFAVVCGTTVSTVRSRMKQASSGLLVWSEHRGSGERGKDKSRHDQLREYLHSIIESGEQSPDPRSFVDNLPITFLPCSYTDTRLYNDYVSTADNAFSITWFKRIKGEVFGKQVRIRKRRTALCFECEHFASCQQHGTLSDEQEAAFALHDESQRSAREVYHETNHAAIDASAAAGSDPQASRAIASVSFDYAEAWTLPKTNRQRAADFFKTMPRHPHFCVADEGDGIWRDYVFAEGSCPELDLAGHCKAQAVISMLDDALRSFRPATHLHLHADNCSGQNKNNLMLKYMIMLIETGRYQSVTLHFLVRGHTKFCPDAGFGTCKNAAKKKELFSLQALRSHISSIANHHVVESFEWRQWEAYLSKRIPGVFPGILVGRRFSTDQAGVMKRFNDSKSVDHDQRKAYRIRRTGDLNFDVLPEVIPHAGFSAGRRAELQSSIGPLYEFEFQSYVQSLVNRSDEIQNNG